ncbi:MAG TPA: site-2 protease family protein [Candidatus Acidoferrum sp.]|nr:site-2 protease family protein [Candidatus Acidoferrum sp.]
MIATLGRLQTCGTPSTLLAEETTTHLMPDLSPEALASGFILFVVFLFSTTCHEAAHALVAKIGGDETASQGGQVTLNPVPHIQREPWGMVVIPIALLVFSGGRSLMGWASAPYDPDWARRHPHRAAWMALAGPATNFTLMLIATIVLRTGLAQGWLHRGSFALELLWDMLSLNLLLGVFNLLPVQPLDGSSAIMLFMPEYRAARYLDWVRGNHYGILGLVLVLFGFQYIYRPIEAFAMGILLGSHF